MWRGLLHLRGLLFLLGEEGEPFTKGVPSFRGWSLVSGREPSPREVRIASQVLGSTGQARMETTRRVSAKVARTSSSSVFLVGSLASTQGLV